MNKDINKNDYQFIFGALPYIANKMDTLLERELKEFDITTKQWYLSVILENLFQEPPTMKAAAKEMGSSYQNVKQVALKLEQKGLLILEKDKNDARVTRLKLSAESYMFWDKLTPKAIEFMKALFENVKKEDLARTRVVLESMMINLNNMDNKILND